MKRAPALVVRRCLVCDWQGEVVDDPNVDPITPTDPTASDRTTCPSCHAPTERVRIIRELATRHGRSTNPLAAALGRRGGLKGGPARAAKLTPKRRREIARRAAQARWKKGPGA